MTELTEKIYDDTSSSALWSSIFFYIFFSISISENFDLVLAFMMTFSILVGVVLFILSERDVRKWVGLVRFSDFIEIKYKEITSRISPRVGRISLWVSIISILILSVLVKWLPLLVNIGLVMIISTGFILHIISTEIEHIPVRKKDVPKDIETELTKLLDRITKKKEND